MFNWESTVKKSNIHLFEIKTFIFVTVSNLYDSSFKKMLLGQGQCLMFINDCLYTQDELKH